MGLCLTWLLFPAPAALAAMVTDLYQAETRIAGEEVKQREEGFREAFAQVLVKVTGSRSVLTRQSLAGELENAAPYVQQFSYRVDPGQGGNEAPQRFLLVSFDRQLVDRLLQEQRLPVWSENRPAVLVWMGLESKGRRRLFDPERDQEPRSTMERAAHDRGLPLLFPLMDLEDQTQMQVADLWGEFESNIRLASRRYSPDMLLTVRLVESGRDRWQGDWSLYEREGVQSWDTRGNSLDEAVSSGVDRAADMLAARFAPLREERQLSRIRVQVSGVDTLAQYAEVMRHIGGLSGAASLQLVSIEGDRVTFDVYGGGSGAALQQDFAVGGIMEPDVGPATDIERAAGGVDLYYRLR